MLRDYQKAIDVDLCFQSFEQELAGLPGKYLGVFIADGGCVALRPFDEKAVEMKRLFVYPEWRGKGLGRALVEMAIETGIKLGYERMSLDTIQSKMPSAVALYHSLGFEQLPARGGTTEPELLEMELDLLAFAAKVRDAK